MVEALLLVQGHGIVNFAADALLLQIALQFVSLAFLHADAILIPNMVGSWIDPLGDYPPRRNMGLLNADAWRRRLLKEHRISRDQLSGQSATVALKAEQTSPSGRAVRNEEMQQMQQSLSMLPEAQRQAIQLHHLQGLTLAQVAIHMNRSPAAVAGLLHRGLGALQRSVEE